MHEKAAAMNKRKGDAYETYSYKHGLLEGRSEKGAAYGCF
jgi:hypothetical protein